MARVPFVMVLWLALLAAPVFAQPDPRLSGSWQLNLEASDPGSIALERPMPRGGRAPMGGFGMPGQGGPIGAGPGGMGGPGRMDPREREREASLMREILRPARRFSVTLDGDVVTFVADDGVSGRYRTNGKTEKHQAINGVVETETRWKKRVLVRKTKLENGMSVEEQFEVSGDRLVVTLKASGGFGGRKSVRRVYDRADSSSSHG